MKLSRLLVGCVIDGAADSKEAWPEPNVLKETRNRNVYDPQIHYPFFGVVCA